MRAFFFASLVFLLCGAERMEQQTRPSPKPGINQTMLRGIWWSSKLPQCAAFQVDDSTFYYPDEFVYRRYNVKDDTLHIFLEDNEGILSLAIEKLTPDTLILSAFGGFDLYTRTEPKKE